MQFRKEQRNELSRSWGPESWFYTSLGEPARLIIERAYGLSGCIDRDRIKAQEDVTLAMSIFARRIGCEKSQVTHALLSGSLDHLLAALGRIKGNVFSVQSVKEAWESAFRDINIGQA